MRICLWDYRSSACVFLILSELICCLYAWDKIFYFWSFSFSPNGGECILSCRSYLARKPTFLLIENNFKHVNMLALGKTRFAILFRALQDTILGENMTWEISKIRGALTGIRASSETPWGVTCSYICKSWKSARYWTPISSYFGLATFLLTHFYWRELDLGSWLQLIYTIINLFTD